MYSSLRRGVEEGGGRRRRKKKRRTPLSQRGPATRWYTLTLFVPDACRRRSSNSGRTSGLPSLSPSPPPSLSIYLSLSRSRSRWRPMHFDRIIGRSHHGRLSLRCALLMDMLNCFFAFRLPLPPRFSWIDRSIGMIEKICGISKKTVEVEFC